MMVLVDRTFKLSLEFTQSYHHGYQIHADDFERGLITHTLAHMHNL
jgi:hypothetical protein